MCARKFGEGTTPRGPWVPLMSLCPPGTMTGMEKLEPISLNGMIEKTDVETTLKGLSPGVYPARVLHSRYAEVARQNGRLPAHPTAFGQALVRMGYLRKKQRVRGQQIHCWVI